MHIENGELLGAAIHDAPLFLRVGYAYCVGHTQEAITNYLPRGGGSPTPTYGPARQEVEDGGLWVIDVSDPAEPLAVGFLPLQFPYGRNALPDVTVSSDCVYLTFQGSLSEGAAIVDVSEPSKPVLSERQLNANLVIRQDSLLVASLIHVHDNGLLNPPGYSHGLQTFDVSDAVNPILIGMMSESPRTELSFLYIADIAFRGDYAYVAQNYLNVNGIHVLRLIDPDWRPDSAPAESSQN